MKGVNILSQGKKNMKKLFLSGMKEETSLQVLQTLEVYGETANNFMLKTDCLDELCVKELFQSKLTWEEII